MSTDEFVTNSNPTTAKKAQKMSLDAFMRDAGSDKLKELFNEVRTGSYMACHVAFYESTGIWIPELVPVFQKMDAMTVMGAQVEPLELR